MRTAVILSLGILAAGAACGPAVAPDKPRWHEDVLPIIQGSCASCHGQATDDLKTLFRLDLCGGGALDMAKTDLGIDTLGVFPVGAGGPSAMLVATAVTRNERRMPPPPALPLSEYEIQVLENWAADDGPCEPRRGNRRARAFLAGEPREVDGKLTAFVDVVDADGDTVIGKIEGGVMPYIVRHAGRHAIEVATEDAALTATLWDGTATATVDPIK
jgi:hypothetical protein